MDKVPELTDLIISDDWAHGISPQIRFASLRVLCVDQLMYALAGQPLDGRRSESDRRMKIVSN